MFAGRKEHIVRVKRAPLASYWYALHVGADFVVLDTPTDVESYPLKVDIEFDVPMKRHIRKRDCIVIASG